MNSSESSKTNKQTILVALALESPEALAQTLSQLEPPAKKHKKSEHKEKNNSAPKLGWCKSLKGSVEDQDIILVSPRTPSSHLSYLIGYFSDADNNQFCSTVSQLVSSELDPLPSW